MLSINFPLEGSISYIKLIVGYEMFELVLKKIYQVHAKKLDTICNKVLSNQYKAKFFRSDWQS